jgi:hypothetical protein
MQFIDSVCFLAGSFAPSRHSMHLLLLAARHVVGARKALEVVVWLHAHDVKGDAQCTTSSSDQWKEKHPFSLFPPLVLQ